MVYYQSTAILRFYLAIEVMNCGRFPLRVSHFSRPKTRIASLGSESGATNGASNKSLRVRASGFKFLDWWRNNNGSGSFRRTKKNKTKKNRVSRLSAGRVSLECHVPSRHQQRLILQRNSFTHTHTPADTRHPRRQWWSQKTVTLHRCRIIRIKGVVGSKAQKEKKGESDSRPRLEWGAPDHRPPRGPSNGPGGTPYPLLHV